MKQKSFVFFLSTFLLFFVSVKAQVVAYTADEDTKTEKKEPALRWSESEYNFGAIPRGIPVTADFVFTNQSNSPVTVTHVTVGCGCTVPEFSKAPVAPGESAKIVVKFNAAKKGAFRKTITIVDTSPEGGKVLYIKGEVK